MGDYSLKPKQPEQIKSRLMVVVIKLTESLNFCASSFVTTCLPPFVFVVEVVGVFPEDSVDCLNCRCS